MPFVSLRNGTGQVFSRLYYLACLEWNPKRSKIMISVVSGIKIDLFTLWTAVQSEGGSRRVLNQRLWASIGRKFNPPPTAANFPHRIKSIFAETLLEFERVSSFDCGTKHRVLILVYESQSRDAEFDRHNERTICHRELQFANCDVRRFAQSLFQWIEEPFRTTQSSSELPFPIPVVRACDQHPNESQDLKSALTQSIVHGENMLKSLYDAREIVRVEKRKSQRTDNSVSEENNSTANSDRI